MRPNPGLSFSPVFLHAFVPDSGVQSNKKQTKLAYKVKKIKVKLAERESFNFIE